jgi:hypothetical protein
VWAEFTWFRIGKVTGFCEDGNEHLRYMKIIKFDWLGKYSAYQNAWSGLEVDYIHKYGEQSYKY